MKFELIVLACCCFVPLLVDGFQSLCYASGRKCVTQLMNQDGHEKEEPTTTRRDHLLTHSKLVFGSLIAGVSFGRIGSAHAEVSQSVLDQIQLARKQLAPVPGLIEKEQWDGVRAILLKPPLSDCWTKSSKKVPLLQQYAESVDDELAALEMKEEIQSHLRYLDMAVYNNVFNPIKSVGTAGATKELIRSYYEDPINEYKASAKFLDELIQLALPTP